MTLTGSLTVTFPNAPPGITADFNDNSWRVEATRTAGALTAGLRINGFLSGDPSIGATVGSKYSTSELRFVSPNSVALIGQAIINAEGKTNGLGNAVAKGQLGFELLVTVEPRLKVSIPATDASSWLRDHAVLLAPLAATVVLVAKQAVQSGAALAVELLEGAGEVLPALL